MTPPCTCVTWLIHNVTWLLPVCNPTHFYMRHDSFLYATWLIHMCDMTHSYMWHDSFLYATWLIPTCDMPCSTDGNTRAYMSIYIYLYLCIYIHIRPTLWIMLKYLMGQPRPLAFESWYLTGTNHFRLTILVRRNCMTQPWWVINPVPHNLVRRIRSWSIWSSAQDLNIFSER